MGKCQFRQQEMCAYEKYMIIPISILLFSMVVCAIQDEILIADFEGDDYGSWQVKGDAFGKRPLPTQSIMMERCRTKSFYARWALTA